MQDTPVQNFDDIPYSPKVPQIKHKKRRIALIVSFFALVLIALAASLALVYKPQDVRQQAKERAVDKAPIEPQGFSPLTTVSQEIDSFFSAGAQGFFIWQYSGYHPNSGGQWFDNDAYSFYRSGTLLDDEVCLLLREKGQQYNQNTELGIGVNIWSMGSYQTQDHLTWLKEECGIKTIRIFAKAGLVPGIVNVVQAANQAGVQVIIAIGDYSNGGGGVPQAASKSWYESGYKTTAHQGIVYRTFAQQIATAISGLGVYGIELANEPHCAGDASAISAYKSWAQDIAGIFATTTFSPKTNGKPLFQTEGSNPLMPNGIIKLGYGQMASQNTTRCDSPGPNDYTDTNSLEEITLTSAHYYNDSEKNNALQALQQSRQLSPTKTFYIGEAKAFEPNTPPTPRQRYWFRAEVVDYNNTNIYSNTVACPNGTAAPIKFSCTTDTCIRHKWNCNSQGAQLQLRSLPGQNSVTLTNIPQGYVCGSWDIVDITNSSVVGSGNGCTATFSLPTGDWKRKVVFKLANANQITWTVRTLAVCDDGLSPRNYPAQAEWTSYNGTGTVNWQSDFLAEGMHSNSVVSTQQNEAGYTRLKDAAGRYLKPVYAQNQNYFTFGQLLNPSQWTAKWNRDIPDTNLYIRFRPHDSVYTSVCTDTSVIWNITTQAVCTDGTLAQGVTKMMYTLWPPSPLSWNYTSGGITPQTATLASNQNGHNAYVALYAPSIGFLQPNSQLPHQSMTQGDYFNPPTPMVKWSRDNVPVGNYTIKFNAPSEWCTNQPIVPVQKSSEPIPVITGSE